MGSLPALALPPSNKPAILDKNHHGPCHSQNKNKNGIKNLHDVSRRPFSSANRKRRLRRPLRVIGRIGGKNHAHLRKERKRQPAAWQPARKIDRTTLQLPLKYNFHLHVNIAELNLLKKYMENSKLSGYSPKFPQHSGPLLFATCQPILVLLIAFPLKSTAKVH